MNFFSLFDEKIADLGEELGRIDEICDSLFN